MAGGGDKSGDLVVDEGAVGQQAKRMRLRLMPSSSCGRSWRKKGSPPARTTSITHSAPARRKMKPFLGGQSWYGTAGLSKK